MSSHEKFKKNNLAYVKVREIVSREFKQVVEAVPKERREDREIVEGRYLAACEFAASVASLFSAYDTIFDAEPDSIGLVKSLGDLAFGFETNQFYNTFRAYLHPVLMTSINSWLDSLEFRATLMTEDSAITRSLMNNSRYMWLELIPACAFCLGGFALVRDCSSKLKNEIIRLL